MQRTWLALTLSAGVLALAIGCVSNAESPEADGKTAAAPAAAKVSPAMLEKGAGIYKANCTPCHGEGGKGDGPAAGIYKPPPRDHTDLSYMSTLTDEDIAKVIQMGGAIRGKPTMPSNPQIRGEDMEALVAFVRSLSQK